MNKKKKLIDYEEYLIERLKDNEEAQNEYLNAALTDEDSRVFLLALKHVLRAKELSMSTVSKQTKLNRENLYKMLSKKGNPTWDSLKPVINTLGYAISLHPFNK
jgi:probable addiction module antidote protein